MTFHNDLTYQNWPNFVPLLSCLTSFHWTGVTELFAGPGTLAGWSHKVGAAERRYKQYALTSQALNTRTTSLGPESVEHTRTTLEALNSVGRSERGHKHACTSSEQPRSVALRPQREHKNDVTKSAEKIGVIASGRRWQSEPEGQTAAGPAWQCAPGTASEE